MFNSWPISALFSYEIEESQQVQLKMGVIKKSL
jgi:hypothetical protein